MKFSFKKILEGLIYLWPSSWGGVLIRKVWGRNTFLEFGEGVYFGDRLTIRDAGFISIGNRTVVMSGCYLYANSKGSLRIGDDCSLNHNIYLGADDGGIHVGNHVLIGPNTVIRAANHCFSNPNQPISRQGHHGAEIRIQDDVWIGANCTILPGVEIGVGTIVGAGSVVNKSLPSMSVCVGTPAKKVKARGAY